MILNEQDYYKWDEYVGTCQEGTIFHTTSWLKKFGKELIVAVVQKEGMIIGGMATVKSKKFGQTGYHIPPYTPFFGPLFNLENGNGSVNDHEQLELLEFVLGKLNSAHIDFKMLPAQINVLNYNRLGFSLQVLQSYVVDNAAIYDLNSVHGSKSRYIKKLLKAINKEEIFIEEGKNVVGDILALQEITGERGKFNPRMELLKKLCNELHPGQYEAMVVRNKEGLAVSGAFCPRDKKAMYHLINASRRVDDKLLDKVNLLTTYLMAKKANEAGLIFDFEGSMIPGIANFYQQMGGKPQHRYRAQKSRSLFFQVLRFLKQVRHERV